MEATLPLSWYQLIVIGFSGSNVSPKVIKEFNRLRKNSSVRVTDSIVVTKNNDGALIFFSYPELAHDESVVPGSIIEGVFSSCNAHKDISEQIKPGNSAIIALVEHS